MGRNFEALKGGNCIIMATSLSEEQVNKQLDHMVSFILKEAQEKAEETLIKAREQFAREKAQKIRDERQRIMKQFEKLQKEVDVKEKIEKSNAINQARLRLLKAREEVMAAALQEASDRLPKLGDTNDPKYKTMLKDLVLQGIIKLDDREVKINCRKADEKLVESVISEAVAEYTKKTGAKVKASIDSTVYLPPH